MIGGFADGDVEERLAHGEFVFLGLIDERAHFALDVSASEAPLDMLRSPALAAAGIAEGGIAQIGVRFADLRQLAGRLERHEGALLALARAMMFWHSRHRFCGLCGSPTKSEEAGHMRRCTDPGCDAMHFPRTDPAVIMLVTDGERALLGRNKNFVPGMYSTLAGFVEPGESLEDAVAREVREETAIEVGAVHYHSSQPWPFPANIMLGFYAEATLDRDHRRLRRARGRPLVRAGLARRRMPTTTASGCRGATRSRAGCSRIGSPARPAEPVQSAARIPISAPTSSTAALTKPITNPGPRVSGSR